MGGLWRQRARGRWYAATVLTAVVALCPVAVVAADDPIPAPAGASALVPLAPCRLLDTRLDTGAASTTPLMVTAADACSIPSDATALAVVVSAWAPASDGSVSLWPSGSTPPTRTLTYRRAGARSASTTVALDAGAFLVAATSEVEITIDVSAAWVPVTSSTAGRFTALTPVRVLDTAVTGRPAADTVLQVSLPAAVPPDAVAVLATIRVTASAPGEVAAFPDGELPDTVTVVTDEPHQTRSTEAIIAITASGFFLHTSAANQLRVDVVGWFTGPSAPEGTDGLFVPSAPVRLLDTRGPSGAQGAPRLFDGGTRELPVSALLGVSDSGAVAATLTVIDADGPSSWVEHPAGNPGEARLAAVVDAPYQAISAGTVATLSTAGMAVRTTQGGHLLVEVTGRFLGSPVPSWGIAAADEPVSLPSPPMTACQATRNGAVSYWNTTARVPDRRLTIGTSVRGRPIVAEHWGSNAGPQVLVVTQVHGSECSMAAFAQVIRRTPPRTYGIWLIPTLNPDGSLVGSRTNAQGIDLNRDGYAAVAPETRALMSFTRRLRPTLTIHFHEPMGWVGYTVRGGRSERVAGAMAKGTGLDVVPAGTRSRGWFLWQGQALRVPGHQAVVVELPGLLGGSASFGVHASATQIDAISARLLRQMAAVVGT